MMRTILIWSLFFLFPGADLLAHRVNVFAWCDDAGNIHVEAKYPGGKRVSEGEISLKSESGEKFFEGRTDAEGELTFALPREAYAVGDLIVILNAGMGHRAEWRLKSGDIVFRDKPRADENISLPDEPDAAPESGVDESLAGEESAMCLFRDKPRPRSDNNRVSAVRVIGGLLVLGAIFAVAWAVLRLFKRGMG